MTVVDYCAGGGGKTLALAAAMKRQGPVDRLGREPQSGSTPWANGWTRAGAAVEVRQLERGTGEGMDDLDRGRRRRLRRRPLFGFRHLAPPSRGGLAAYARGHRPGSPHFKPRSSPRAANAGETGAGASSTPPVPCSRRRERCGGLGVCRLAPRFHAPFPSLDAAHAGCHHARRPEPALRRWRGDGHTLQPHPP